MSDVSPAMTHVLSYATVSLTPLSLFNQPVYYHQGLDFVVASAGAVDTCAISSCYICLALLFLMFIALLCWYTSDILAGSQVLMWDMSTQMLVGEIRVEGLVVAVAPISTGQVVSLLSLLV